MNARIGRWAIHADDDKSSDDGSDVAVCLCASFSYPRVSQDKVSNTFGKLLKNLCTVYHGVIWGQTRQMYVSIIKQR